MIELRLHPFQTLDGSRIAEMRESIQQICELRSALSNRAANQAIIEQIGVDVRSLRDESYLGEAIEYHLGLLYAQIGEPQRAADHIERSGTHPGAGGNRIFSDHQRESALLRAHQERAIARSIPSLVIASMPRSASASLTQTLAALLDIPVMRISAGSFPSYYIFPRWLNSFMAGGAMLHDHFGAQPFNLEALREGNVREIFVQVRDPRPAAASAVHLMDRKYGASRHESHEARIVRLYEEAYIPWIEGWIAAASDRNNGLRVRWVMHDPRHGSADSGAAQILPDLVEAYPTLATHVRGAIPEITANFVTGDDDAWRQRVSKDGQARMWEDTPHDVREMLSLRP